MNDDDLITAILLLTDVMSTRHYAAVSAGIGLGCTVAVIDYVMVGLCGVLAVKRFGAKCIIISAWDESRLKIARWFGAVDVVSS